MSNLIKQLDKNNHFFNNKKNDVINLNNLTLNKILNKSDINYNIYFSNSQFKYLKNEYVNELSNNKKLNKKITINTEIKNIDDLLDIIKNHPINNDYTYNINLKALHNIKSPLLKLKNMTGLENIKTHIIDQILFYLQDLHINKKTNENNDFLHTVLYGKPGTGKTEIAMIIGEIFCNLGILKNNKFKKVTRKDLVGGYLGQTAILTGEVIKECLGGVLFIDEAYSLGNKEKRDSYSKECIDTLCEALSFHKNELMVIIAGYKEDLNECFFSHNLGLESRFPWNYEIESYNYKELADIFMNKVDEIGWTIDHELNLDFFKTNYDSFNNYGRDMEILLAKIKIAHSKRVFNLSHENKTKISLDDIEKGFSVYLENNRNNKKDTIDKNIINSIYT